MSEVKRFPFVNGASDGGMALSSVQEAAREYIGRHWQVTLLEPQGKKCIHSDWLTRIYGPDDFASEHNIGIKSVDGLADADFDCVEAVFMAEVIAPKTKAVYGRKSRRRSHWLFHCPDIKEPLIYKDEIANKKTIVELRVNHQSMAPPSIHPEGERVEWESSDPVAMDVEKSLLVRSIQLIATGVMVARYYNPPGNRHEWGLALSGFLRQLSLTHAESERIFERAGQWAKDDRIKDRLDAVRNTYARPEDAPTTGAKKLEELIGDQGKNFVATLHKIWGNDAVGISKTKLEQMNAKHAVVFRQGGKLAIMTEATEDGKRQIRWSSPYDFSILYPQKVQAGVTDKGKTTYKRLGDAWVEHPKRRFYNGVELAPDGKGNPGYYNLWQGFSVEPRKGDWSLFKRHILLLANNNTDHARYILAWLAETVQHPERPIGIALAFKGKQGTGKSTFARWFGELFGPHFMHLDSEHRLLGQFNAHLHNAIVVLADEAVWAGGKAGLGALKRMITEPTLAIEPKGLDVINVKNMLHMIVASNEDWVVPANFDNRRFAIFEVSDEKRNDHKFFGAVEHQLMHEGGLSALLYDLLDFRSEINLREIPDTDELQNQKVHSVDDNLAWLFERLQQGQLCGNPWPVEKPGQIQKDMLHSSDFLPFLERHRKWSRSQRSTETQLGKILSKYTPFKATEPMKGGKKQRLWEVPPLDECRAFFEKASGMTVRWDVVTREPGEDDEELPGIVPEPPF
jgi:hypothetical protein